MTIGERIKAVRKRKGMTQNDLAIALHIPYQGISQYERGTRNPKYETVKRIAAALECDVSELLTSHEESEMIIQKVLGDLEKIPGSTNLRPATMSESQKMSAVTFRSVDERIAFFFSRLNDDGKEVAADRVQELTEIPKYQKKKEEAPNAPQDNP